MATNKSIEIGGTTVAPGTRATVNLPVADLYTSTSLHMPVQVICGRRAGPVLFVSAAIHGDELNGVEIVRRLLKRKILRSIRGTLLAVPIVNVHGFLDQSRYLPDRRDLNRSFPGSSKGSVAARLAHLFVKQIVSKADFGIDLHTGAINRSNLPQIRANLRNPDVVTLTLGFGSMVVLHSEPTRGTLRHAATMADIPAVTVEAGGPSQLELAEVKDGVKGIETLLTTLGMVKKRRLWGDPEPVYYRSSWVRADNGGILLADVSLGSTVRAGDLLGTITDPMNNAQTELYSPYSGRIIGMARNQVVMPGFAAFHVGIQADVVMEDAVPAPDQEPKSTIGGYVDGMSE